MVTLFSSCRLVATAAEASKALRLIAVTACVLATAHCASHEPPELYEEVVDPNENMVFAAIVQDLRAVQEHESPPHRTFHAKVHGCVSGSFELLPSRPPWAQVGVFAEAKPRPFVLRFTNGTGETRADDQDDVRGAALKLFDVPGDKLLPTQRHATTQDFVMLNVPTHFSSDPREFADFMIALHDDAVYSFLLWHPRMALRIVDLTSRQVPSMVEESYNSVGAFRVGDKAAKFKMDPCVAHTKGPVPASDPDFLRHDLARRAAKEDLCFVFGIQLQTDPVKTPIEDVTVEWENSVAPTVAVAKLHIPRQNIAAVKDACDALEFSPWHGLEAHRPLGQFNRVRRPTYAASQKVDRGGKDRSEPTSFPSAP